MPEVAGNDGVAVLIHAIGEVLAGHASGAAFPPQQLPLINEIPFLHSALHLSTSVLAGMGGEGQAVFWKASSQEGLS